jgi:hypothetical protein
MQMDKGDAPLLAPVTERTVGGDFRVANALGHGFVEKVYENAPCLTMPKLLVGGGQVPVPADQPRSAQSRNPSNHPLLRVLTRPILNAKPIAVGTLITERPPHRTVQAAFPHTAPTSGV